MGQLAGAKPRFICAKCTLMGWTIGIKHIIQECERCKWFVMIINNISKNRDQTI